MLYFCAYLNKSKFGFLLLGPVSERPQYFFHINKYIEKNQRLNFLLRPNLNFAVITIFLPQTQQHKIFYILEKNQYPIYYFKFFNHATWQPDFNVI